ncbi:MAG: peptidase [Clostridia bacterium]|nr:peptidase [Clostridia bacterium]
MTRKGEKILKKVELLAPVGKIENAYAAIENGADALFIGGKLFNARQYADNFTNEELEEIIKYAKLRSVKVYITVNILIKETEIEALFHYLNYLNGLGVDGIISQDLGVVRLVNKYFPQIPLHASTQMTANSLEDVLFLQKIGFKRVVLARELHLDEIRKIVKGCDVEIETFVHGALCYSYSGQCLMSSLIGGRSGNRGRCAQPCRMKYTLLKQGEPVGQEEYVLSLKDICTVAFIPELIQSGISSFKIEGRMKSPEYVASVVRTYRKYIDSAEKQMGYKVDAEDIETVKGVFNRGGFSNGYYLEKPNKEMLTSISPRHMGVKAGEVTYFSHKTHQATIFLEKELNPGDGIEIIRSGRESVGTGISRHYEKGAVIQLVFDKYIQKGSEVYLTKNHTLLKNLKSTYNQSVKKTPIDLRIYSKVGEPIRIQATCKAIDIVYSGDILEAATRAPITKENALKQLTKFGNTPFILSQLEIDWDETGYVAISKLNEMRREVVAQIETRLLHHEAEGPKAYAPIQHPRGREETFWSIGVRTLEQLEAGIKLPQIKAVYWEWQYNNTLSEEAYRLCQKADKFFYLALPHIIKDEIYERFKKDILYWETQPIEGYLIRNYGTFNLLKHSLKHKNVDYNLNIMNNEAIAMWHELGAHRLTLSVETPREEIQALRGILEKIIYGYLPVMTTAQCLLQQNGLCKKQDLSQTKNAYATYELQDRKGAKWPIDTDCKACNMQILTEKPLVSQDVHKWGFENLDYLRLNFTSESPEETRNILEIYLGEETAKMKAIKGLSFKSIE